MLVFVNHDDMRSLELMEEMLHRGYYVSDQFKDMKYADVIYMGMRGIDRKNRLQTHQETVVIDEDMLAAFKSHCLILTLIHNEYLEELSAQYQFRYSALLDKEDFIVKNSILTAEGLLSYMIMHRRYPLYESEICILGFGHCAKPIIDYLVAVKANVSVAVRKAEYQKDIEDMGARYLHLNDLDLSKLDILINTIPYVVVKENEIDKAHKRLMIVDIASYPYGIDHHYALSKGLNCQILSSIPCKYAYGYAGKMVADEIERELENA